MVDGFSVFAPPPVHSFIDASAISSESVNQCVYLRLNKKRPTTQGTGDETETEAYKHNSYLGVHVSTISSQTFCTVAYLGFGKVGHGECQTGVWGRSPSWNTLALGRSMEAQICRLFLNLETLKTTDICVVFEKKITISKKRGHRAMPLKYASADIIIVG